MVVPDHFAKFKGSNNKSTVQNETQSYSIGFGQMSESDKQNLEIFKEYGARLAGEKYNGKEPRTFFEMMQDFNEIAQTFDIKFTWDKVISQNPTGYTTKSTALVYGECGQGKSTVLNQIVN